MASAAFWAACGCTRIYATPTTHIGSVGTILVIPDMSKMAKQMGVDVLVFTNDGADLKGAGTPGTEVTDKHKAYFRGMVNGIQSHFSQAVMDGRSLSKEQIRALAGRVFIADQAQSLGLIDGHMLLSGVRRHADRSRRNRRTSPIETHSSTRPDAKGWAEIQHNEIHDPEASNGLQGAFHHVRKR